MIISWTWSWTSLSLVFALFFFLHAFVWKRNTKIKKLPPGPRGFPIFGSLHLLGKSPHRDFHKLAKKYGPIMFMRLGFVPIFVVSSSQAAEQFLKEHDLVFASRPSLEASKYLLYGKDFVFAEYGSYWRTVRKICTLELLTSVKISYFQTLRKQEIDLLTEHIKESAAAGVVVDLSAKVSSLIADVICRMIFGKKYVEKYFHERGLKAMAQEIMRLMVIPDLGDYFPQIASLDLQGLTKSKKVVIKVFDDFLEKIIDEHVQSKDPNRTKDFVDVMLSFMGSEDTEHKIEREHVKAILTDILMGATDTSSTAIEWALSALLKHPRVMKRVQRELENVVGLDRMVQESDLDNLEYLDMVLKETLRLYPPGGILPRESREDCTINGFDIPKKSLIIISAWSIGRDAEVWTDPEKFFPERFAGSDIDLRGRHFQLLPFGSGRRGCPGISLGLIMVKHVLAQIVHCFDWELPNGMLPSELDMTEKFGLVTPRAKHLMAISTYRLNK